MGLEFGLNENGPNGAVFILLDNSCFLERSVCAVLLDVAHSLGRDGHEDGLAEFCYENAALLEVCLAANLARWVELRSTRTV